LHTLAEAWHLPVLVSFRRHDLFSNRHPLYAGDMGLAIPASQLALLQEADLLLVAGARLSDVTTQGYRFPALVRPEMRLVHVHADPAVIGNHFPVDMAIACDPAALFRALGDPSGLAPDRDAWIGWLRRERERITRTRAFEVHDGIAFEEVVARLGACLAPDAIVTVDAGNFGAPVYRVVPFEPPQRLLAPIAGAMGFGVPAAVAAALRCPSRQVVCLVGDGGFLMTGSELAVAMERRLPLKVVVSENRVYGSIRIHREREYPGRTTGTGFANPDLVAVGRAYGFDATHLRSRADLDRLPELLASPGPEFVVVDTSLAAVVPARNPPQLAPEERFD
jgi:acetolactate synthase-1/2/3 large subunit